MSILGVAVRTRPEDHQAVAARLAELPGVDVAVNPGDGRLVLIIEDAAERAAAATLGDIATWREILSTLLVYEYSGPDSPGPEVDDYRSWRASLGALGDGKPGRRTPQA